jgi:hypothetical protein
MAHWSKAVNPPSPRQVPRHPLSHVADVLFALAKIWVVKVLQTLDEIADHSIECLFHVNKLAANVLLDQRGDFVRHCRMHR